MFSLKVWGMYGKNGKYGICCSLIFWRQDEATKHTNPNYLVQGFGGYYGNIWFSELSFFRRKLESYMIFTPPSSISSGAHGHFYMFNMGYFFDFAIIFFRSIG